MRWIAVESSVVSALGYDAGRRRLGIEFQKSLPVYFYHAVSVRGYEDFLKAESTGLYLTQKFLPKQGRIRAVRRQPVSCLEIAQQQLEAAQMDEF